ncbi:hypothetical protein [Luteimicrobium sp. DT211]|uniref:hypothetical protein n=1 Tax=Luteimicrobium sp. DT211 TaxID=3393412 RepID=UPI003CF79ACB
MNGPAEVVVVLGVVGYLVVRRMVGEPAEGRRMILLPVALVAVGLTNLGHVALAPVSVGVLAASTVVSLLLGVLRGVSVRVFERDGVVWMRYTVTTVALLAANLALKLGTDLVLRALDRSAEHAVGQGLALTLGAGLLAEGAVVLSKAVRSGGRVRWERDAGDRQQGRF